VLSLKPRFKVLGCYPCSGVYDEAQRRLSGRLQPFLRHPHSGDCLATCNPFCGIPTAETVWPPATLFAASPQRRLSGHLQPFLRHPHSGDCLATCNPFCGIPTRSLYTHPSHAPRCLHTHSSSSTRSYLLLLPCRSLPPSSVFPVPQASPRSFHCFPSPGTGPSYFPCSALSAQRQPAFSSRSCDPCAANATCRGHHCACQTPEP